MTFRDAIVNLKLSFIKSLSLHTAENLNHFKKVPFASRSFVLQPLSIFKSFKQLKTFSAFNSFHNSCKKRFRD